MDQELHPTDGEPDIKIHHITMGEILGENDYHELAKIFRANRQLPHKPIMAYLEGNPDIIKRLGERKILPSYFAYCIEWALLKIGC